MDKQLQEKGVSQAAAQLANRISAFRPEISLYVLLFDDDERALVEDLASHAVDGYFYRDELDFHGWFRILSAELAEKSATPFYDKLKQYVRMARIPGTRPAIPAGTP